MERGSTSDSSLNKRLCSSHALQGLFVHVMFSCCQHLRGRRRPRSRPGRQPEGRNLEGAARGKRGLELGGVDLVHGGEVGDVGQVDRGLDDIGKGGAGSGQQGSTLARDCWAWASTPSGIVAGRGVDGPAGRTGTPCCRPGYRGNTGRWRPVRYRKTRRSCSCFSPYDQIESVSAAFAPGGTIRSEHRA